MKIYCKLPNPQWQIYTWQSVRVRTVYRVYSSKLEEELKSSVKGDYVKIKITILGLGLEI